MRRTCSGVPCPRCARETCGDEDGTRESKEKRFFARLGICIFATSDETVQKSLSVRRHHGARGPFSLVF